MNQKERASLPLQLTMGTSPPRYLKLVVGSRGYTDTARALAQLMGTAQRKEQSKPHCLSHPSPLCPSFSLSLSLSLFLQFTNGLVVRTAMRGLCMLERERLFPALEGC